MSINHIQNVWHILVNEGLKSALSYDFHETKRRHSSKFNSDGKHVNGLDSASRYITESNRPEEYKQTAIQLVRDMTHNEDLYFPKTSGLKDLIDATLSGRLQRKTNTIYRVVSDRELTGENISAFAHLAKRG